MSALSDALYRQLVEAIPADLDYDYLLTGGSRAAVVCGNYVGTGLLGSGEGRPAQGTEPEPAGSLRDLARLALSWNLREAGIGMAALCAYWNNPERHDGLRRGLASQVEPGDSFLALRPEFAGRKVGVIGHFPILAERVAPYCELSVFERQPQAGDYPDSAAEFLLPQMDVVFITGATFPNKTLPRLLELCPRAMTILVGASVPLSPLLFDHGVTALSGLILPRTTEQEWARVISQGCRHALSRAGRKVMLRGDALA